MNSIIYEVKKNVAKRKDGFNPVTSEKGYSTVTFEFDSDWKQCDIVTANFFVSADDIVKSEAQLLDNMTASFEVPARLRNTTGKIFCGVVGTYTDENDNIITIGTQIVTLNALWGLRVTEDAPMILYEQVIGLINKIDNNLNKMLELRQLISNMFSTKQNLTDKESSYPSVKYLENYYYDMDDVDYKLAKKANADEVGTALANKIESPIEYRDITETATGYYFSSFSHNSAEDFECISEPVSCVPGEKFKITATVKTVYSAVICYDENQKIIGKYLGLRDGETLSKYIDEIFEVPTGCKYVAFNSLKNAGSVQFHLSVAKGYTASVELDYYLAPLKNNFFRIRNAVTYGVKNNGAKTEISSLFENLENGTLIYFPAGTYLITDPYVLFDGLDNITIEFHPAAQIVVSASSDVSSVLFDFKNCTNITLKNISVNGKYFINHTVSFNNCKNITVEGGELQYNGNTASTFSSGIRFSGSNSRVLIDNIKIHHIYTGTIGEDGYGYSTGIAVNGSIDGYTKNMVISNCEIYTIRNSGNVVTDGDGIFLIQRPTTTDRMLCNIVIRDCEIHNCSLRCIKASCRGVTVDHCNLYDDGSGVVTRGYLADFQFADSSSIINSTLYNNYYGCVAINYDSGKFVAQNNNLTGSGTKCQGQGFVLNRLLGEETAHFEKATVIIENNFINDVQYPFLVNYEVNESYDYNALIIRNNEIGYFSGDSAIRLDTRRINSIAGLIIDGIMFKYGSTKNEILAANNDRYPQNKTDIQIIDIGNSNDFINPIAVLSIKNVVAADSDDWNEFEFTSSQKSENGNDYILTDTDKSEIADIVISEFDDDLMAVLGGDESATE